MKLVDLDKHFELNEAFYKSNIKMPLHIVKAALENTPTVDAVEVVRCKDCKYLCVINKVPVYAYCRKHDHTYYLWEEDAREHFCSWGEKEENEAG